MFFSFVVFCSAFLIVPAIQQGLVYPDPAFRGNLGPNSGPGFGQPQGGNFDGRPTPGPGFGQPQGGNFDGRPNPGPGFGQPQGGNIGRPNPGQGFGQPQGGNINGQLYPGQGFGQPLNNDFNVRPNPGQNFGQSQGGNVIVRPDPGRGMGEIQVKNIDSMSEYLQTMLIELLQGMSDFLNGESRQGQRVNNGQIRQPPPSVYRPGVGPPSPYRPGFPQQPGFGSDGRNPGFPTNTYSGYQQNGSFGRLGQNGRLPGSGNPRPGFLSGRFNRNGSQGQQGYPGQPGFQGGQYGPQGNFGSDGYLGPQNTNGRNGYQGSQGNMGPNGFQGSQGRFNQNGSQGQQGYQGQQGFQNGQYGPQDTRGPNNFQGQQGNQRPEDFQGRNNFQGPRGNQGFNSYQGQSGFTESPRNQGSQGYQGSQDFQNNRYGQNDGNQGFQGGYQQGGQEREFQGNFNNRGDYNRLHGGHRGGDRGSRGGRGGYSSFERGQNQFLSTTTIGPNGGGQNSQFGVNEFPKINEGGRYIDSPTVPPALQPFVRVVAPDTVQVVDGNGEQCRGRIRQPSILGRKALQQLATMTMLNRRGECIQDPVRPPMPGGPGGPGGPNNRGPPPFGQCSTREGVGRCGNPREALESIYIEQDLGDRMLITTNSVPDHCYGDGFADLTVSVETSADTCEWFFSLIVPKSLGRPTGRFRAHPIHGEKRFIGILKSGALMANPVGNYGKCDVAAINNKGLFDPCDGHADPTCTYHVHKAPTCLRGYDSCGHLGWVYDGYPIYGKCALRVNGRVQPLKSCYKKDPSKNGCDLSHYTYSPGPDCHLDQANGFFFNETVSSPSGERFQAGSYVYFMSPEFPFISPGTYATEDQPWCKMNPQVLSPRV